MMSSGITIIGEWHTIGGCCWAGPKYIHKTIAEMDKEAALAHHAKLHAKKLARLESRWNAKERRLGNQ